MEDEPQVTEPGAASEGAGTQPPPADPEATAVPDSAPVPEHAAAVQQDLDELQAKAAQRDEFLSLAQRTQADFDNFRKRAAREQQVAERRGVSKVVRELLPALDNLERALAATSDDDQLAVGIRLVQAELASAMARVGIQNFSPKGEPFDPNVHEAMATQPVEGTEPGTVVDVYQAGYLLDGDVIRPAKVIVAA